MTNAEYRNFLIQGILDFQTANQLTKEELAKKPIRILERIYNNVK